MKVNADQVALYQTQIATLERKLLEVEASKEAQISKLRNQAALITQRDAVRDNVEMLRIQKNAKDKEAQLDLVQTKFATLEEHLDRQRENQV